ncbi:MAG: ribonuclease J [Proteobacteria bacterium]|nr:ribonuclease J [Pseudomonadota bacterium]
MIINPPHKPFIPPQELQSYLAKGPAWQGSTVLLPLGGCGEFGRNMTALLCDDDFILVDCGVLFSRESHLGLSGLFYEITPLVKRYGHPKGYVITHAHRDHVGALMYFLERWPAPVYATPWTIACIEGDIQRQNKPDFRKFLVSLSCGERFSVGSVYFEYISVNHSIPESYSVFIETRYHRIAHSGDFKIDRHSSLEKPADLQRWQEIASDGMIDVFLCDSTNAHRQGASPSEESTRVHLGAVFARSEGRIFVSTFSSNLWRLIHIIEAARQCGKRVYVLGFGMNKTLEMGKALGVYEPPKEGVSYGEAVSGYKGGVFSLSAEEHEASRDNGDVFIVSGSQMEPRSVLSRIINRTYGSLSLQEGDTVVFSSRTIPGHEREIVRAQGMIMWQGASVVVADTESPIHVSGHAYSTDIDIMLSLIKPRYFIPIHGELMHLMANAQHRKEHPTFMWKNQNGCLLYKDQIFPYSCEESFNECYVDRYDRVISHDNVIARRKLALGGVMVVSGIYMVHQDDFTHGPVFENKGSALDWQDHDYEEACEVMYKIIEKYLSGRHNQDTSLDQFISVRFESFLSQRWQCKSQVLSHVWVLD